MVVEIPSRRVDGVVLFAIGHFLAQRLALRIGDLEQFAGAERLGYRVAGITAHAHDDAAVAHIGMWRIGRVGGDVFNLHQIAAAGGIRAVAFQTHYKLLGIADGVVQHRAHQQVVHMFVALAAHACLGRTHFAQQAVQVFLQRVTTGHIQVEQHDVGGLAVGDFHAGGTGFRRTQLVHQLENTLVQVYDAEVVAGRLGIGAVIGFNHGGANLDGDRVFCLAHGRALQSQVLMRAYYREFCSLENTAGGVRRKR